MMDNWKIFEKEAYEYLKKNISLPAIELIYEGKSDSNIPDIRVRKANKTLFFIEEKLSPAQSGQIVFSFDGKKYEFSKKSKGTNNKFVKEIIKFINENIENFKECSTSSKEVKISQNILIGWIIEHYKMMNVKFIVTSTHKEDFPRNFIRIFPLEEFAKYFVVTANFRRKKSGTSKMPKKDFENVKYLIKNKFGKSAKLMETGKLFFNKYNINKTHLGERYYVAEKKEGYEVRRKSKTNSPQIVFSIKYSAKKESGGLDLLKKELKKY
jgi:hypothetical protein